MNYTWRQTAVSRWSDKNKNIWSEFLSCNINILGKRISNNLEVITRNWSSFDPSFHRFSPTLERSGHREDENKNKKKLSKGTIQEELQGVIVEGVVFLCIFFFFLFLSVSYTESSVTFWSCRMRTALAVLQDRPCPNLRSSRSSRYGVRWCSCDVDFKLVTNVPMQRANQKAR